jgi:hypothetical protein
MEKNNRIYGWYCPICHTEVLPENVTFEETHDIRYGGCGHYIGNSENYFNYRDFILELTERYSQIIKHMKSLCRIPPGELEIELNAKIQIYNQIIDDLKDILKVLSPEVFE